MFVLYMFNDGKNDGFTKGMPLSPLERLLVLFVNAVGGLHLANRLSQLLSGYHSPAVAFARRSIPRQERFSRVQRNSYQFEPPRNSNRLT